MASRRIIEIIVRARDEASKVLKGIGTEAHTLALALSAVGAAGVAMTTAMTMTAARTEELGLIAHKMGEVHGYTTTQIDATQKSIKRLGIATQTARLLIAQLIGSQTGLARATDIARAAQNLATLGATDSSEAAANLAYAISSLQPRLLRKYRIYVSLVKVKRAASAATGKFIQDLTEEEIRLEFVNAVLREAANYTSLYEEKMRTASGQLRSMPRYLQEVANTLGQVYVPAMRDAIMVTNEFLDSLSKTEGAAPKAIGLLVGMAGSFAVLTGAGLLLAPKLVKIAEGITALSAAAGIWGATALGTVVAFAAIATAIGGVIVAWSGLRSAMREGSRDIIKAALEAGKSYDELYRAGRYIYTQLPLWDQLVFELTGGMDKWIRRIIGTRDEYERLTNAFYMAQFSLKDYNSEVHEAWRLAKIMGTELEWAESRVRAVQEAYGDTIVAMATFFGEGSRAAESYAGDLMTLQRRRQYLEARMEEEGWSESLDKQLQSNAKQIAALEDRNTKMQEQNRRMMGQMLMTAAQAAGLGLGFVLELGKAYDVFTAEQVAKAGLAVSTIEAIKAGALTEEAGIAVLQNIPTYQRGGVIPGPIGQPRLIVAHGGETVSPVGGGGLTITIGALYGTDRRAAQEFSRQVAREMRLQGVITR